MDRLFDRFDLIFEGIGLSTGWLVAVLVAFPLAVLFLGEVAVRAKRRELSYAGSIGLLRNVALPLLALYFLATKIASVPADSLELKVLVSLTVVVALIALLGIVNGVLFSGERAAIANVPKLFLDLGRVIIVAIGLAVVLSTVWDFDLGELVTALGVSSIVIGLALQDTLGNLFSGITLLYEQPFSEGDHIVVGDVHGRVVEVNWRAVRLETREHDMIIMPHYMVAQAAIVNRSRPLRAWAQKLEVGFSYDDAPNVVKEVMFAVLDETPGVLRAPAPEVKTIKYNDFTVDYEVEYFIESFAAHEEVSDAFLTRVWYAAQREGLTIPFPIRTLVNTAPPDAEAERATMRRRLDRAARMLSPRSTPPLEIRETGARYEHYGRDEEVIPMGRRVNGLYLVLDGEADVSTTDAAGQPATVVHLGPGDFFTEIVLPGTRQGAIMVTAATDLELIHLTDGQLRRLANRDDRLARKLEDVNAARRQQIAGLRGQAVYSANGRRDPPSGA